MRLLTRSTALVATAVLAVGTFNAVASPQAAAADADSTTINIVGITDLHGHIATDAEAKEGGAVGIACAVQKARAQDPNALFVSDGDNIGGSAYISSILQDQPTMDVLNAIGLDVTAAGNHEFDRGITDLTDRVIPAMNAPILAANVTGNQTLSAEGNGNGVFIKEVNGVKVGFVGVVTDELPALVSTSALEGLQVASATDVANQRAAELKDGNADNGEADVVVVLAHEDAEVYGHQFNGSVDAVVAGHTHVPFASVVDSTQGTKIAVVQPDHYGNVVGNISLTVTTQADGSKKVTARTAENTSTLADTTCTDAYGVKAIVDKAASDSEQAGKKVVAKLGSDFLRGTQSVDGVVQDPGANRGTESTASNLIADSFAWWVQHNTSASGTHFIGLMNPGGVRADYKAGDLTYGQAYTVQPFGNTLAYATYTGAQLREILAEQWKVGEQRPVLTLGVSSNVHVYINQDVADALEAQTTQSREGLISSIYVDGAPLADDDTVVVATNNFLITGGDSFTGFAAVKGTDTGVIDQEATSEYFAAAGAVTADYAKRQVGVDVDASADGSATARLTGLSFTNASEQSAPGAAKSVSATVALKDGSTSTLATADVDRTLVSSGVPETGTVSLKLTLPQTVATQACTASGLSGQCAFVSFVVTNNDGSTRQLDYQAQIVSAGTSVGVADVAAAPSASSAGNAGDLVVQGPAQAKAASSSVKSLASTGANLSVLPVALLGLGAALLLRRRQRRAPRA